MSDQMALTGMVLLSAPAGEYDKRVVLLTAQLGRITAFARGARRPKSSLLGSTEPFSFGTFYVIPGRDAYTLVGTDISNYFMELRSDLTGTCYGLYFLELAGFYSRENLDARQTLELIVMTLRALIKNLIPKALIRRIYELRLMVIQGEFDVSGSIPEAERAQLHPSTVYTMQFIQSAPLSRLFAFKVSEEVQEELDTILTAYLKKRVDRPIRSLEMLESCQIIKE